MRRYLLFLYLLLPGLQAAAQLSPVVDSIPMSDGKKIAADIYKPAGMTSGPVILIQTPYNRLLYRFSLPLGVGLNQNGSNYIFVITDWRGFYGSAAANYLGSPSMSQDGYSVVEWIAAQPWSNGKVGTWGPSALGRVQFQTAKANPPHLTCICPLVASPLYEYEEYFPNGCLRTEYVQQLVALGFCVSTIMMHHTVRDFTWTFVENANDYPDSIAVPCFMIGGWYDHTIEPMLKFFKAMRTSSPVSVRDKHRLLMGPWVHGGSGTAQVGTTTQGELSYPNAAKWNDSLALLYFDYYLRGVSNNWNTTAVVQYYQMGENTWQTSAAWPPSGATNIDFYLHKNGAMDHSVPTTSSDSSVLIYNPLDPSPTIGGPTLKKGLKQGPYDQRDSVENRNDVLIYTTDVLTQNVVMKGSAIVHLQVSSNRRDTDFGVRLTDVYPDGRSILVNDGIMRMRFRNGNTGADTSAISAGNIYDCTITLPNTSITFLTGHKIRLDITSSNYPRFNRNMNTGGPMYPGNSMDSLVSPLIANNTVYCNSGKSSYISLPLVGYKLGVANTEKENGLLIYPDPANERIQIISREDITSVTVMNMLGETMHHYTFTSSKEYLLNTSELPNGIYLIEVAGKERSSVTKVVVQH
jgi:predicted acyl esterase